MSASGPSDPLVRFVSSTTFCFIEYLEKALFICNKYDCGSIYVQMNMQG